MYHRDNFHKHNSNEDSQEIYSTQYHSYYISPNPPSQDNPSLWNHKTIHREERTLSKTWPFQSFIPSSEWNFS